MGTPADHREILDLVARFADAINQRDFSALSGLFALGGVWEAEACGRTFRLDGAEIGPGFQDLLQNVYLVQLTSPTIIKIEDEHAQSSCTLLEAGEKPLSGVQFEHFGICNDHLRKIEGRWSFQSRRLKITQTSRSELRGTTTGGRQHG